MDVSNCMFQDATVAGIKKLYPHHKDKAINQDLLETSVVLGVSVFKCSRICQQNSCPGFLWKSNTCTYITDQEFGKDMVFESPNGQESDLYLKDTFFDKTSNGLNLEKPFQCKMNLSRRTSLYPRV